MARGPRTCLPGSPLREAERLGRGRRDLAMSAEVWEEESAATIMARQLEQDDENKHRLRLAGIDPLKLSFEERQQKVLALPRSANGTVPINEGSLRRAIDGAR